MRMPPQAALQPPSQPQCTTLQPPFCDALRCWWIFEYGMCGRDISGKVQRAQCKACKSWCSVGRVIARDQAANGEVVPRGCVIFISTKSLQVPSQPLGSSRNGECFTDTISSSRRAAPQRRTSTSSSTTTTHPRPRRHRAGGAGSGRGSAGAAAVGGCARHELPLFPRCCAWHWTPRHTQVMPLLGGHPSQAQR